MLEKEVSLWKGFSETSGGGYWQGADSFLLCPFSKVPLKLSLLQYLLGGLSQIDVEDWKRNTEYSGGYTASSQVVQWFWKAVENYDEEMRARLLQFVTGTSKVPMNGFSELQGEVVAKCCSITQMKSSCLTNAGSQGPRKFCLKNYGLPSSLPRAHTWWVCFLAIPGHSH